MIRDILIYPNPVLHQKSVEVKAGYELQPLLQDMWDTLYDSGGVGLAAVQIGVPARVCVMDVKRRYVFINPVFTGQGYQEPMNEGCLSLPGVIERVMRYPQVHVQALDENLKLFSVTFTRMEAQCVQHEVDHMDGIVMPDKFDPPKREMMRLQMKHRKKKPRIPSQPEEV
jgi:peptide deformylase